MTRDQSNTAIRQGWDVFETCHEDTGQVVEIERIDCPAQAAEDIGLGWDALPEDPIFDSDADAERFVRDQAAKGDAVALAALEEITYSHLEG